MSNHLVGLAVALGIGLLMGVERERSKGRGAGRRLAGVRTFALVAESGALAAASALPGLMVAGAVLVAGLALASHLRDRGRDPGVTTEVALFVAYLLGVTAIEDAAVAAAVGSVATILLAARERLHRFSIHWLSEAELRDALILTGLALILLPLLPDRPLLGEFLNPRVLMRLVVLLLTLQALGHVAQRVLGDRHGLVVAGFASGFISSTATFGTMGRRFRGSEPPDAACAHAAVASGVATPIQLLLIAAAVNPAWLAWLWLPALAAGVPPAAFALARRAPRESAPYDKSARAAISLKEAAIIAAILSGVQIGARWLKDSFGDAGLTLAAAIAGLADFHAASATLLMQGVPADAASSLRTLALPLGAAFATNSAAKLIAAWLAGGAGFALRVAPAIVLSCVAFVLALRFHPAFAA